MTQNDFIDLVKEILPSDIRLGVAWIDASADGYTLDFEPSFALVVMLPYSLLGLDVSENHGRLASIGCFEDYHRTLEALLERVTALLMKQAKLSTLKSAYFIDKHGNDDRRIAYRTGKVFYGKNNLLIHPDFGSAFTIGYGLWDLKNSIEVERVEGKKSACGNCRRCIDACPHGALSEVDGFNPSKCISWINQKSGELSAVEMQLIDNWLYGCDLCQLACPYNIPHVVNQSCGIRLEALLESSNKEIKLKYGKQSFAYLGGGRLRRNAAIIHSKAERVNL